MKRLLLVALLVLSFTVSAQAGNMMFGVKAGFNMFKVFGDDVPDAVEYYYGAAFGGFFNFTASEMFAIQPELLYSMKGWSVGDESLKLGYIDIPVLVKVMIPTEGAMDPCIFAGPSLGFLLSAKAEDVDVKDNFTSTDFGMVVGAGFDYQLGSGTGAIMFDARYSMGFTNLPDEGDYNVKNNGFQFMLGYGYKF